LDATEVTAIPAFCVDRAITKNITMNKMPMITAMFIQAVLRTDKDGRPANEKPSVAAVK
jgi:hypothetical protein